MDAIETRPSDTPDLPQRKVDSLLQHYGLSHEHPINELIHFFATRAIRPLPDWCKSAIRPKDEPRWTLPAHAHALESLAQDKQGPDQQVLHIFKKRRFFPLQVVPDKLKSPSDHKNQQANGHQQAMRLKGIDQRQ